MLIGTARERVGTSYQNSVESGVPVQGIHGNLAATAKVPASRDGRAPGGEPRRRVLPDLAGAVTVSRGFGRPIGTPRRRRPWTSARSSAGRYPTRSTKSYRGRPSGPPCGASGRRGKRPRRKVAGATRPGGRRRGAS